MLLSAHQPVQSYWAGATNNFRVTFFIIVCLSAFVPVLSVICLFYCVSSFVASCAGLTSCSSTKTAEMPATDDASDSIPACFSREIHMRCFISAK